MIPLKVLFVPRGPISFSTFIAIVHYLRIAFANTNPI